MQTPKISKRTDDNAILDVTNINQPTLRVVDKNTLLRSFQPFQPISLEDTNKSSKMLKRFDNKYVVNKDQFETFLSLVLEDFSILEIDGIRQFSYSSCYYDNNYHCYFDHIKGKRRRFKVRTRKYVDSGLMFFEVKLKGLRGQTDKQRIPTKVFATEKIENKELKLLTNAYKEKYKISYACHLKPKIIVDYRRCTLVSKRGGERVTIDFSLAFTPHTRNKHKVQISENFIIIETKSANGKGLADGIMKQLGVRQASKCSKYCLGAILLGEVAQNNDFLPMVKLISKNIISGERIFQSDRMTEQGN